MQRHGGHSQARDLRQGRRGEAVRGRALVGGQADRVVQHVVALEGRGEHGDGGLGDIANRPHDRPHLVGLKRPGAVHPTGRVDDGRARGADGVVVVQADGRRGPGHLDGVLHQPHRAPRGQHEEVTGGPPAHEGLGVGLPDGVVEDEGAVEIRGEQTHAGEHSPHSPLPPCAHRAPRHTSPPAHQRRNAATLRPNLQKRPGAASILKFLSKCVGTRKPVAP